MGKKMPKYVVFNKNVGNRFHKPVTRTKLCGLFRWLSERSGKRYVDC